MVLFFAIMARLSGVFILAPFFSSPQISVQVKVMFSVMLSVIMFVFLDFSGQEISLKFMAIVVLLVKEVLVGFLIGGSARMLFAAVTFMAETLNIQMGFQASAMIDPSTAVQASPVGILVKFLALSIFLLLEGHHIIIEALHYSFITIPPGFQHLNIDVFAHLVKSATTIFEVGIQLATPVMGAIFFTNAALALLARVAPQTNVFVLGISITILVGLITLMLSLPYWSMSFNSHVQGMFKDLVALIQII